MSSEELLEASPEQMFLALVISDGMTVVPDMFKTLGSSKFLRFIELFGGQHVYIPSAEVIKRALRDANIYQSHVQGGTTMRELAESHGISYQRVQKIINSVTEAIEAGAQNATDA
jgi:Mor family transcriptional regulator